MNEQITQLITEFANANNMDVAVVEELVTQAITLSKPHAGGRPLADKTLNVRDIILKSKDNIKNMTIKEIATMFGFDTTDTNNAIRFHEKAGVFVKSGVREKEKGQKGRKEAIWTSV